MECYTLKYRGRLDVQPEKSPDGRYAIRNVPIFQCHTREDIGKVDSQWMRQCVADQQAQKQNGFLPRVIVGHNSDDPNATEKPVVCHLDNYRYNESDQWLYADYVDIEERDLDLFKRFPGRSAEANVKKPQIHVVALLGGTPPYFRLPDVHFKRREEIAYYSVELPNMDTTQNQQPNSDGVSPEEKADYEKFCKYMAMYEASKQKSEQEEEPMKEVEEKKDFSAVDVTAKYNDLSAKYNAMLARVDELTAAKEESDAKLEAAEWTAKYSSARVPANRINVADEVKFIMDLPKEKRQVYFDKSIKGIESPSTTKVEKTMPGSKPEPGSAEEAEAVKKYCAEKKLPFAIGQQRYIKEVRNAE
jgi:hypothetical protein